MKISREEWTKMLKEDNMINVDNKEELLAGLIVAGAFTVGPDRTKVSKWIGELASANITTFVEYWENLVRENVFSDGKINVSEDFNDNPGIEFCILITIAQGLVKRELVNDK